MIFSKKKTKKIRKRSFRGSRINQTQLKTYLIRATFISIFCALLIAGRRTYGRTIGATENIIDKVVFAPASIDAIRDMQLYIDITESLKGRNYLWTKRLHKGALREELQQMHPIIDNITLEKTEEQTVYVTISFMTPKVVWQTPTNYFLSYQEHLYPVNEQSILLDGIIPVQLPRFSSGRNNINGIYRAVSEQELTSTLEQIMTLLGRDNISELIYQPGGRRIFVTYKGKRVYFNLQKDIDPQVEKLLMLEAHRTDFDNIWTIDVGSRDELIVR